MTTPSLTASWFGRVDYPAAWAWQKELYLARLEGERPDSLMLLEHPPTYTLGRRAIEEDRLRSLVRRLQELRGASAIVYARSRRSCESPS